LCSSHVRSPKASTVIQHSVLLVFGGSLFILSLTILSGCNHPHFPQRPSAPAHSDPGLFPTATSTPKSASVPSFDDPRLSSPAPCNGRRRRALLCQADQMPRLETGQYQTSPEADATPTPDNRRQSSRRSAIAPSLHMHTQDSTATSEPHVPSDGRTNSMGLGMILGGLHRRWCTYLFVSSFRGE
jgi:hypothetical protein